MGAPARDRGRAPLICVAEGFKLDTMDDPHSERGLDAFGRPLSDAFGPVPDLRPYAALTPEQSLDELNPAKGANAEASMRLDLDEVDAADMAEFNLVLWRAIKGDDVPFPGTKRASTLELTRGR